MDDVLYMGYRIRYNRDCTPLKLDWEYAHESYDGPEDGRCGRAATIEDAKNDIEELES